MLHATQCLHCKTIYRVNDALLAPHRGIVRCGVCKQVFDAELHYLEEKDLAALKDLPTLIKPVVAQPEPAASTPAAPAPAAPRQTVMPAQRKRRTLDDEIDDNAPPSAASLAFIKQAKRKKFLSRLSTTLYTTGACLLLLSLLAQTSYFWRHEIVAVAPSAKPVFSAVCARLGCTVGIAADIDQISLESYGLQAQPSAPDVFEMSLVLRNNSGLVQTWPHVELSLNDADGQPVIRKVFTPEEYLPAGTARSAGLAAHDERMISRQFKVLSPGIAGYQIFLFHP